MTSHNWIDLAQDADTGIETLRAHFEGHAYDPHWLKVNSVPYSTMPLGYTWLSVLA
jgi:hypothetical protein